MPKDAKKNVDRYKIRGGDLNEFEFRQNQGDVKESTPGGKKSANTAKGGKKSAKGAKKSAKAAKGAKKSAAKKSQKNK